MTHQAIIIPFPVNARVRKIRETALKLIERPTVKSAEHYRSQVLDPMMTGFQKIGLTSVEAEGHARRFWLAVEAEAARILASDVSA